MTSTALRRLIAFLAVLLFSAPGFVLAQEDEEEALEEEAGEYVGDDADDEEEDPSREMADERTVEDTAEGLGRPMPRPSGLEGGVEGELDAFEAALGAYEEEISDYRQTITRVIEVEYRSRRREIRDFYNREIDILRVEERQRRNDAIADFERFLRRYPDDEEYTPDVMFRLAELYYERAGDDYNQADIAFQEEIRRYDLGLIPEEPAEPEKDFGPTIEVFSELIARFPDYRQIDGAFYLMGICHEEMFEIDEAEVAFRALVQDYPDSDFAQEAWLRLGEFDFDVANFEQARASYLRALDYGESRWYDKILFKLGWSHYLLGDYHEAITSFQQLLAYYEEQGDGSESALEEEALQYFAISIAEEDWDLDGTVDPMFVMGRVDEYLGGEEDYTLEVLDRLAEILMENQRFEYAIEVYRHILDRYPLDRRNPRRHEQMVIALARLNMTEEMVEEQRRLSELYGRESEWYAEQERQGNLEAMAFADQLARDNLLDTAVRFYNESFEQLQTANATDNPALRQEAIEGFRVAARLYEQFLTEYPFDPEAYNVRVYWAQSLYYSGAYLDAADQFALVRDSNESDELRETAAYFAIYCYELALGQAIDDGELEPRAWPAYRGPRREEAQATEEVEDEVVEDEEGEERDEPAEVTLEQPIPELSRQWAAAIDSYVGYGLNREDDPNTQGRYAYAAAKLFFDYRHLEEARERFIAVLENYCGQQETGYASIFLIESYRLVEDFENMQFWADEIARRSSGECISFEDPSILEQFNADIERYQMGAVAAQAEAYIDAGEYELAAQEYVRLANEYEGMEFAPLGLFNAGLIYEQQLQRYELAMRQFDRLIEEYPESPYIDIALVRIAVNSKKFFDFDRAITTFMTLHERGYSDAESVEHPIIDAAQLLEYSQRYEESAEAYLTFVDEYPESDRAPAVLFKAAELYGLAGDEERMVELYRDFRREYGNTFSELINIDAAVIYSLQVTAEYYEAEGRSRDAEDLYQEILDEFQVRQPDDVQSRYAAGGVVFRRAMDVYDEWDSIDFGEDVDEQTEALELRRDGMEAVVLAFEPVYEYNSAERSVCAAYMQGRVFQGMAETLVNLPMPDFRGDIDAEDEYILMIEDFANQFEDAGVEQWEALAYPLMQQSGVQNECTINTMRQLNRLRGPQYPVFREEIRSETDWLFSPQNFAVPPYGEEEEEEFIDIVTTGDDDEDDAPEDDEERVEEEDPFEDDPFDE